MTPDMYNISSVTSGYELATSVKLRDWRERFGSLDVQYNTSAKLPDWRERFGL